MWGKGLTSSHDTLESANVPFYPIGTGRRVDGTNGLRRKRRFEEDVESLEKDQAQTLIENSASMRDEKSILIGTVWIDQIEDLGALRERMRRGRC